MWFGTGVASGWGKGCVRPRPIREWFSRFKGQARLLGPDYTRSLAHYSPATASRHVFFCSVDSQFVLARPASNRSLWVHLGDENQVRLLHRTTVHRVPFNGLTIPYRVGHWIAPDLLATPLKRDRTVFIYYNTNLQRHVVRLMLYVRLALLNRSDVVLEKKINTPLEAARRASDSRFCLCPTGDSTGFTARLYFSLVHGCTPVWIDGWQRNIGWDDLALPFKKSIDWRRLVVYMPNPHADVVGALRRFQPDYDYIEQVRPMLLFDAESGTASSLAVREILERVCRDPCGVP